MKNKIAILVFISLLFIVFLGCAKKQGTGVEGILKDRNGDPIKGAYVKAYKSPVEIVQFPNKNLSKPTKDDGYYELKLKPGKYYLMARKKTKGKIVGVLEKGDMFSVSSNPVDILKNEWEDLDFTLRIYDGKGTDFVFPQVKSKTGIEGIIVDQNGRPLKNAIALAYQKEEIRDRPDFASLWTKKDGKFKINVLKGGRYQIIGRVSIMRPPALDEPFGFYEQSIDNFLELPNNKIVKNIKIILKPFSPDTFAEIEKKRRPNPPPGFSRNPQENYKKNKVRKYTDE